MWFNLDHACAVYAQFIATRMCIHFMCAYVYLHLHPLIYWNAHFKYIYQKSIVVFIRSSKVWFKTTWCAKGPVTRGNFTGNLQRNSTLKRCKLRWKRVFANFTSSKSRIALQVARKTAPYDRALIHVCLAYLFLHSGQVLSAFKCYFKRKYLNLIDSNCDVDESCPSFFTGTVLATGPECVINIYVILGRRNLFEMGAARSARESRSVALVWRLGILVTGAWFFAHEKQ